MISEHVEKGVKSHVCRPVVKKRFNIYANFWYPEIDLSFLYNFCSQRHVNISLCNQLHSCFRNTCRPAAPAAPVCPSVCPSVLLSVRCAPYFENCWLEWNDFSVVGIICPEDYARPFIFKVRPRSRSQGEIGEISVLTVFSGTASDISKLFTGHYVKVSGKVD